MPDPATPTSGQKSAAALPLPQPQYPTDGQTVDASEVPFAWTAVPDAGEYVLQVARDADFDDIVSTLTAGESTSMTLYSTLEAAEQDYHWRVRSGKKAKWGPAACFRPTGAERLREAQMERERQAHAQAAAQLQAYLDNEERVPVEISPDQGVSDRTTVIVLSVLIISFILLIVILMIFGQVTYPADAVIP